MEYFTRAWATGELSDEEYEGVEARYRTYIETLDPASAVRRFATTVGLNDAYIDRVDASLGDVRLRLLTGDQQRGYRHTEIIYRGARVSFGEPALKQAVEKRPTEIWYDEFSESELKMLHRFLLVQADGDEDRGEFHIEFAAFDFQETPADKRELPAIESDGHS